MTTEKKAVDLGELHRLGSQMFTSLPPDLSIGTMIDMAKNTQLHPIAQKVTGLVHPAVSKLLAAGRGLIRPMTTPPLRAPLPSEVPVVKAVAPTADVHQLAARKGLRPVPAPAVPAAPAAKVKLPPSKISAVDPLARLTGAASPLHGDEVQAPLVRNPYAQNDKGPDYENGYEFAQSLGHVRLGQANPDEIAKWNRAATPWKQGFADAAAKYGLETVGQAVVGSKIAAMTPESVTRKDMIGRIAARRESNRQAALSSAPAAPRSLAQIKSRMAEPPSFKTSTVDWSKRLKQMQGRRGDKTATLIDMKVDRSQSKIAAFHA